MLLQLFCQFQSTDSRHSRIIIHLIRIHDLTALNKTTLQDNHLQPGTFPINPRRQPFSHIHFVSFLSETTITYFGIDSHTLIVIPALMESYA